MPAQNPNEEQQFPTTEIIHLTEEFQLFKRDRTEKFTFEGDVVQLFSDVTLVTDIVDPIPMTILAEFDATFSRIEVLTPLDPRQGYPLDTDDFSAHSRQVKIETLQEDLLKGIAGFTLLIGYADDTLQNMFRAPQPAHIHRFLDRLHLVLSFPDASSFAARAYYDPQSLSLTFEKFFPTDIGPLPLLPPIRTPQRLFRIEEGFRILLPNELDTLESIQGKFLYIPD